MDVKEDVKMRVLSAILLKTNRYQHSTVCDQLVNLLVVRWNSPAMYVL